MALEDDIEAHIGEAFDCRRILHRLNPQATEAQMREFLYLPEDQARPNRKHTAHRSSLSRNIHVAIGSLLWRRRDLQHAEGRPGGRHSHPLWHIVWPKGTPRPPFPWESIQDTPAPTERAAEGGVDA